MSKFGIELLKSGDSVLLANEYTTNPQAFHYTGSKVVGINGQLGNSAEDVMNMFASIITKRAKTISLIIELVGEGEGEKSQKTVVIPPQSIRLRFIDWLNDAPDYSRHGKYYIPVIPQNQNMTYGLEVTPDGKTLMQGTGQPTTQALKNAYPY